MNNHGTYSKLIINPADTEEGSEKLINYVNNELVKFKESSKVISSCEITIEYCPDNGVFGIGDSLIDNELLIMSKDSSVYSNYPDTISVDDHCTLYEKISKYLEVISSRDVLTDDEYSRFKHVITVIYERLLTVNNKLRNSFEMEDNNVINGMLKSMNMKYRITYSQKEGSLKKEYHLTRLPEDINAVYKPENTVNKKITTNNISELFSIPENKEKLQSFMDTWFLKDKTGKVWDRDRDEFYHQFSVLYNSIVNPVNEEGVLEVVRQKKVMCMNPMISYVDINKILQSAGFNYSIVYRQEQNHDDSEYTFRPKYRHSLSLKGDK